jgi:hypothetical protein
MTGALDIGNSFFISYLKDIYILFKIFYLVFSRYFLYIFLIALFVDAIFYIIYLAIFFCF